jgi:hypothetical protein
LRYRVSQQYHPSGQHGSYYDQKFSHGSIVTLL